MQKRTRRIIVPAFSKTQNCAERALAMWKSLKGVLRSCFIPSLYPSPHLTPTRYCARLAIRPVHSHRIKVARAMRLASLPNDNCLPGVKAVEEKYVIRLEECAIKREVSFVQIRLKSRSPSSSLLFNLHKGGISVLHIKRTDLRGFRRNRYSRSFRRWLTEIKF